jgi:GH24 family phage-related lysozyme (muramidase)
MTEADYIAKLKKDFEGEYDFMYLDSRGNVTIGVGILLASASAAKSAGISFKNRKTGKAATPAEIEKDFNSVKAAPKGMDESKYEKFTELVATGGLDARLKKELNQAKSDAKSYYPDFDKLPDGAQWALVDMAFNLGGAGLKKYVKLKAALDKAVKSKAKEDWEVAAKESGRNGIQSSRNSAIYAWIAQGY